jgi:hypothetical protein
MVPLPQCALSLPVTSLISGSPVLSASFSRHDFRAFMTAGATD